MRWIALSVLVVPGLLLASMPAVAEETTAPTPQAAAGGSDPNQIVCVHTHAMTGSRIGTSMQCHTVKEWADMERSGTDQLNMAGHPSEGSTLPAGIGGRPH